MTHGSPGTPGGSAETAAHAELLDRLGHFAVTPRVIVDLGGEITARSDVLQRRFPDARVLALTFAGTQDGASPPEDANGPGKARPWWRKVLAMMTGVPLRAERRPADDFIRDAAQSRTGCVDVGRLGGGRRSARVGHARGCRS